MTRPAVIVGAPDEGGRPQLPIFRTYLHWSGIAAGQRSGVLVSLDSPYGSIAMEAFFEMETDDDLR